MMRPGTRNLAGDRWTALEDTIRFIGLNLTGATLEAHVRSLPDTPGTPLVDLDTVTTPGTQGLRIVYAGVDTVANHIAAGRISDVPRGYASTDMVAVSIVYLRINETTMEAMPAANALGEDVELHWDMLITPSGGLKKRYLRGTFTVEGGVTQ